VHLRFVSVADIARLFDHLVGATYYCVGAVRLGNMLLRSDPEDEIDRRGVERGHCGHSQPAS
ncbi:MAG: hypothetical protein WCB74_05655, partial [Pseudolabrys sp.]